MIKKLFVAVYKAGPNIGRGNYGSTLEVSPFEYDEKPGDIIDLDGKDPVSGSKQIQRSTTLDAKDAKVTVSFPAFCVEAYGSTAQEAKDKVYAALHKLGANAGLIYNVISQDIQTGQIQPLVTKEVAKV